MVLEIGGQGKKKKKKGHIKAYSGLEKKTFL